MKTSATKILQAVLIAIALGALLIAGYFLYQGRPQPVEPVDDPTPIPVSEPVQTEPETPPPEDEPAETELPTGKLVITNERKAYESSLLTLRIPALDLVYPILNGTDRATLRQGVGLYEYAQLPGEGNRNVSLAGHRNQLVHGKVTDDAPFYYIDKLTKGDYIYLCGGGNIYRYLYESTTVVEPDDWSPIYTAGYSCVTITSCTPIGISDHRIVVRARLDEVIPDSPDFTYPAKEEDPEL